MRARLSYRDSSRSSGRSKESKYPAFPVKVSLEVGLDFEACRQALLTAKLLPLVFEIAVNEHVCGEPWEEYKAGALAVSKLAPLPSTIVHREATCSVPGGRRPSRILVEWSRSTTLPGLNSQASRSSAVLSMWMAATGAAARIRSPATAKNDTQKALIGFGHGRLPSPSFSPFIGWCYALWRASAPRDHNEQSYSHKHPSQTVFRLRKSLNRHNNVS